MERTRRYILLSAFAGLLSACGSSNSSSSKKPETNDEELTSDQVAVISGLKACDGSAVTALSDLPAGFKYVDGSQLSLMKTSKETLSICGLMNEQGWETAVFQLAE